MAQTIEQIEFQLLNDFQRDFPLCPAPFAELAARLGVAEGVVLHGLEHLRREGKISRVGPVFAPKRIGASTLAAMVVPPERLDEVALVISRFPEVNHNYEREHRLNLWFVVTAGSDERLQAALNAIERAAGFPILRLPLEQEFHIDLGFSLCLNGVMSSASSATSQTVDSEVIAADEKSGSKSVAPNASLQPNHSAKKTASIAHAFIPPRPLEELERRLVMALQEGLPIFIRPFQVLAQRVGCDEIEVLERIQRWCDDGIIKRFGVVVRHYELGYNANAMLVHDIPDHEVERIGNLLAEVDGVTLCYRRPRVLPEWPYNLFCMIHGQMREQVVAQIAKLRREAGLEVYAHEILFSRTRYKQSGARYV